MTPHEIRNKTFEKKMGGYRIEEVNAYLAEVAVYLQSVLDQRDELDEKIMVLADRLEEYREDEESLRAALIGAQKLGDSVVRDAKKKAESILEEATHKADTIVNDAKNSIDREALTLVRMQGQVTEFKTQILNMYKRHMEMISALPEELNLPGDVQKIVNDAVAVEEDHLLQADEAAADAEQSADAYAGYRPQKQHNHFGELQFGEDFHLTRNE